ncbi:MAG: arylsulfatase, partial [Verrucomicrobiota bacterium]
ALSGEPIESSRHGVVHHSISGHFSYRYGPWKLILAKGSGGWTSPKENEMPKDALPAQLYDLEKDPGETKNLYLEHPDKVDDLLALLLEDVRRGRSTDGGAASNDVEDINLWKSGE